MKKQNNQSKEEKNRSIVELKQSIEEQVR